MPFLEWCGPVWVYEIGGFGWFRVAAPYPDALGLPRWYRVAFPYPADGWVGLGVVSRKGFVLLAWKNVGTGVRRVRPTGNWICGGSVQLGNWEGLQGRWH